MLKLAAFILAAALAGAAAAAPPPALFTDPPADKAHPARSVVLHIPTGVFEINGLAYIPAGAGPHPVMVLMHGLPGNEKNLDLAQAVRRAGWTVVTFNYRGSWGSPGDFSVVHVLEDARATLAYLRQPAVAAKLGIDPRRIVLAGHSMGGWAAAVTGAQDSGLKGVVLISAADMAATATLKPEQRLALARDNAETLHGITPEEMAIGLGILSPDLRFPALAPGLARRPLLVLSADDGLAADTDKLVAAARARGGKVTAVHAATDHAWNDKRIFLETQVIDWLATLR
jgi:pimeloyl-ACP methyl ester carboxylesterase